MPTSTAYQDKVDAVNNIMNILKINECSNKSISLLSGGQRKRTNIATELLASTAKIILMDEGTSGLDYSTASNLIKELRMLADVYNYTIICTIHQPSSGQFYSFDKLLMLSDGHCVYYGKPTDLLDYLETCGYTPPISTNPSDFFSDLLSNSNGSSIFISFWKEIQKRKGNGEYKPNDNQIFDPDSDIFNSSPNSIISSSNINNNLNNYIDNNNNNNNNNNQEVKYEYKPNIHHTGNLLQFDSMDDEIKEEAVIEDNIRSNKVKNDTDSNFASSYCSQLYALLIRSLNAERGNALTKLNISETIIIALIAGICWFQMEFSEERIRDINGFCFFSIAFWFFVTIFTSLLQFIPERRVLKKERDSGYYHLSAYLLAKSIAGLPVKFILPIIYSAIALPMALINLPVLAYILFTLSLILSSLTADSIGMFIGTLTLYEDVACAIGTVVSLAMMVLGNFYISILPSWIIWATYLSAFRYAYDASAQVLYGSFEEVICSEGQIFRVCNLVEKIPADKALQLLNINSKPLYANIIALVIFILVFRFFTYLSLRFVTIDMRL
jgi:ABC-type multidrug transport system ATPase subunit/ABC-type multidrug transport system permease subunit